MEKVIAYWKPLIIGPQIWPHQEMLTQKKIKARRKRRKELFWGQMSFIGLSLLCLSALSSLAGHSGELFVSIGNYRGPIPGLLSIRDITCFSYSFYPFWTCLSSGNYRLALAYAAYSIWFIQFYYPWVTLIIRSGCCCGTLSNTRTILTAFTQLLLKSYLPQNNAVLLVIADGWVLCEVRLL